jgi:hypothetical protein
MTESSIRRHLPDLWKYTTPLESGNRSIEVALSRNRAYNHAREIRRVAHGLVVDRLPPPQVF